ncbi:MAG: hypothetical protein NTY36_06015 [Deltaproteobacteria bacterium]|nr:hypothetical protein [Deltaproteobacteria bacterium]
MIKISQNDKKAAWVQINSAAKDESPMVRGGAGLNNFVLQKAGRWQKGKRGQARGYSGPLENGVMG